MFLAADLMCAILKLKNAYIKLKNLRGLLRTDCIYDSLCLLFSPSKLQIINSNMSPFKAVYCVDMNNSILISNENTEIL